MPPEQVNEQADIAAAVAALARSGRRRRTNELTLSPSQKEAHPGLPRDRSPHRRDPGPAPPPRHREEFLDDFGVAMYCGFGRQPGRDGEETMREHSETVRAIVS